MKIDATFAILHLFENTTVMNDLFVTVNKGIFVGILFDLKILLFFKVFISSGYKVRFFVDLGLLR